MSSEEIGAADFVEGVTQAGFTLGFGISEKGFSLSQHLVGENPPDTTGVFATMGRWFERVPKSRPEEGRRLAVSYQDFPTRHPKVGADGKVEVFTSIYGHLDEVLPKFVAEIHALATQQFDLEERKRELIAGFKSKVEEEIEDNPRVREARARIARNETEGRRLKGDLLAIQVEMREERAERLEPYLYVAEGRGL